MVEENLSDLEKPTVLYTIDDLHVYITETLLGTQSCELSLITLNKVNHYSLLSSEVDLLFTEEISAEKAQHTIGPQQSDIMVGPSTERICFLIGSMLLYRKQ